MVQDLTPIIGENLAELRRKKGFSLDKLSELSGVSKAMIGQIERGESNPTVNTLWKIAAGLHIPFGKLLDLNEQTAELVRLEDMTPILNDNSGLTLYRVFSFAQDKGFEIFSAILAPHAIHEGPPHVEGSEEYVVVYGGQLEITVDNKNYLLSAGDGIRFKSDRPHVYRNPSATVTAFQNIIYYR